MLAARPDVRAHLIAKGGRVGVMAVSEVTTDIPEQRHWKKPAYDDPQPYGVLGRVYAGHRIPMDVYHGRQFGRARVSR